MGIGTPRKGFNVIAYNDQKRRRQERDRYREMTDRLRELEDYFNTPRPETAEVRALLAERDGIIEALEAHEELARLTR